MANTVTQPDPHLRPPDHCEYAGGACDQLFTGATIDGFVAFPGDPPTLASTIQSAVEQLNRSKPNHRWVSWQDMQVAGQIVFCEICKTIRNARTFVAEISTCNYNVLFETGYAFGLRKPLLLLRDTSFAKDAQILDELGFLDTIGYESYTNADDVYQIILKKQVAPVSLSTPSPARSDAPIFVVFPPIRVEGVVRLDSALKKSAFNYRQFDPAETPRLSLVEIEREISISQGVVLPLLDPNRVQAALHNARCAFVAGAALARQKHVLILQEGHARQPIDYRDLVSHLQTPSHVASPVEKLVRRIAISIQRAPSLAVKRQEGKLARLDLGDIAAENEEEGLLGYFVPTAQFVETRNGHARLVVGRKGTGKSAIFSQLRKEFSRRSQNSLVVDIKPEGYQLQKLKELLQRLDVGAQEQVLVAIWDYLILGEIAQRVVETEEAWAFHLGGDALEVFKTIRDHRINRELNEYGDFAERLLALLNQLGGLRERTGSLSSSEILEIIWNGEVRELRTAIGKYLKLKGEVWLLVDNLDKNWPIDGANTFEILALRGLLDASRKIERQLAKAKAVYHSVVFLRTDIYELLVRNTPDRGKDTRVSLDAVDVEVFKEILRRRAEHSLAESLSFEQFMTMLFERHVGGEDTIRYMYRHTLGRARDVLRLVKRCIEVALNRGRQTVSEVDVADAVRAHSNDMLRELSYEIGDTHPAYAKLVDEFVGAPELLGRDELEGLLQATEPRAADDSIRFLIAHQFLGVRTSAGEELFVQAFEFNIDRMLKLAEKQGLAGYVIHPAFRHALHIGQF